MTTPDTSAVRAWARDNGYTVADRGRLPAEVTEAYLADNGGRTRTAAKPASGKQAVARKAPAKKAGARNVAAEQAAARADEPAEQPAVQAPASTEQPPAATAERTGRPKPSLVSDDRRLVALAEELAALSRRVEALEKSAPSKNGKTPRFRRRS